MPSQLPIEPWIVVILLSLIVVDGVLVLSTNWRVLLLALLSQYALSALILVQIGELEVAGAKSFTGIVVCLLLFMTIRVVVHRPLLQPLVREDRLFRGLGLIAVAIAAYQVGRFALPVSGPTSAVTPATWLVAAGLLVLFVAREPLRIGLGLLTFQTGFELLYASFDDTLMVNTLLGMVTLLLTLAIAYLVAARAGRPT